jgi:UDP-N-acetylglucosamine--N-acetylmuramyl-(pentapeptide) pyrophosphoryl-undecaprenol N-acetylglucosamine transferase
MRDCIAFTGGGTGGHVFPALAVLDELQPLWHERLIWIGSARGMEREIVLRRGLPYYGIPAGKLRRYLSVRNLFDLLKIGLGLLVSVFILLRERPRVLFSKGGFVSVPPVLGARLLGIPVLTHESDLVPGLATRINARFAQGILISFAESVEYFAPEIRPRVVHTGNPVRRELLGGSAEEGRRRVGCVGNQPILLVLGGSLGSQFINRLIEEALPALLPRCFVVHQMGAAHFRPSETPGYYSAAFFNPEMPHLLAAARLVVCRSGANTVWELAALGKPAVLIPLSRAASRGDQIENARYMERHGAAVVLEEGETTARRLVEKVLGLVEDERALEHMSRSASALGRPESARTIARIVAERSGSSRARAAI